MAAKTPSPPQQHVIRRGGSRAAHSPRRIPPSSFRAERSEIDESRCHHQYPSFRRITIAPHLREAALIAGLCLVYFALSRFLGDDRATAAAANAEKMIVLEGTLGIFREATWNHWVAELDGWVPVAFNWAYIITFMAVIPVAALAYYVADRDGYLRYRNVIVLSFFLALAAYAIFPVAPPRMMPEFGFVDTTQSFGPAWYHSRDGVAFFNAYAAMPSLHFAWAVAFGWLFFRQGGLALKVLAFAYPAITLAAIIVTANHYFADAAAGAALMFFAYALHEAIHWGVSLSKRAKFYIGPRALQDFVIPAKAGIHLIPSPSMGEGEDGGDSGS